MSDSAVISRFTAKDMQKATDFLRDRFNQLLANIVNEEVAKAQQIFDELLIGFQQPNGQAGSHTAPGMRLLIGALAFLMRSKNAIECGLDAGITAQALILGSSEFEGQVVGIDTSTDPAQLHSYPNYKYVREDALAYLRKVGPDCVDIIILDDDHSESHVRDEIIEIKRVLRPQGIAIFHDVYYHPHIEKAIRELLTGWDMIMLPAWGPPLNVDMGCGIARKPA